VKNEAVLVQDAVKDAADSLQLQKKIQKYTDK
jgi:hypothetical protein